jgi:integrase
MKQQRLRIAEYHHSPTTPWVLEGYKVNGKRKRIFFRTRSEAELALRRLKLIQRQEGEAGAALDADARTEAVRCIKRLSRFGRTLTDATDYLIQHLEAQEAANQTLTVERIITERLAKLRATGKSVVHIKDVAFYLGRFADTFGSRASGSIASEEIESWLEDLGLGPQSYNNYRSRLYALFEFGVKRELLVRNPIARIEPKTVPPAQTQIIAPSDLGRLLEAAPSELLAPLAISYFAGLRTAEILRLSWEDINLKRRFINVLANKAKSAQRRLVHLESNLADWLRPCAGRVGKLWNDAPQKFHAELAKLYANLGIVRLPNSGRHSYASYWLAQHHDSAALAARLGHTTSQLIFSVYRELADPETAKAYWNIKPSSSPSNVVAIA